MPEHVAPRQRMTEATATPGWPLLLRRELAAAYVGMSPSTFDKAVKEGLLPRPVATVYSLVQWHRGDLDAWAEDRRAEGQPAANPWDDAA